MPVRGLTTALSDAKLVTVLFVSTFFDALHVGIGGLFNIRPSFVVAALAMPVLIYRWVTTRQPVHRTPIMVALLGLSASFFVATAINWSSPMLFRGFVTCVLLVLNIAFFVVVYWYAHTGLRAQRLLDIVVGAAVAYSCFGIVTLILYQAGFPPARYLVEFRALGDWTMSGGSQSTPRPWFLEPNIGSYLAAIGVMAFARALTARRHQWRYGIATGVVLTGVLLTYSRGAWLGAVLGGGTVIALLIISGTTLVRLRPTAGLIAVLAAVLVVLSLAVPSVKTVLVARLMNILNINEGTGRGRLMDWWRIAQDGLHRPILGHGANAYQVLLPSPLVAENATVEIFHTSGVIGLAFYLAVTVLVAVRFLRMFHEGRNRAAAIVGIGGYVVLVVCSQMNPSFWGNMYWALFGLIAALLAPGMAADGAIGDREARDSSDRKSDAAVSLPSRKAQAEGPGLISTF